MQQGTKRGQAQGQVLGLRTGGRARNQNWLLASGWTDGASEISGFVRGPKDGFNQALFLPDPESARAAVACAWRGHRAVGVLGDLELGGWIGDDYYTVGMKVEVILRSERGNVQLVAVFPTSEDVWFTTDRLEGIHHVQGAAGADSMEPRVWHLAASQIGSAA